MTTMENESSEEPYNTDCKEKFSATMIDLGSSDIFKISIDKLSSELKSRKSNAGRRKKFMIAHILRERDFDPQSIKGVLEFLPKKVEKENKKKKKSKAMSLESSENLNSNKEEDSDDGDGDDDNEDMKDEKGSEDEEDDNEDIEEDEDSEKEEDDHSSVS